MNEFYDPKLTYIPDAAMLQELKLKRHKGDLAAIEAKEAEAVASMLNGANLRLSRHTAATAARRRAVSLQKDSIVGKAYRAAPWLFGVSADDQHANDGMVRLRFLQPTEPFPENYAVHCRRVHAEAVWAEATETKIVAINAAAARLDADVRRGGSLDQQLDPAALSGDARDAVVRARARRAELKLHGAKQNLAAIEAGFIPVRWRWPPLVLAGTVSDEELLAEARRMVERVSMHLRISADIERELAASEGNPS